MPFNRDNLSRIGSAATAGPASWTYQTTDALADVVADGYFDTNAAAFRANDFITVNAADGRVILTVESVGVDGVNTSAKGSGAVPELRSMVWRGAWQSGIEYPPGSTVVDDRWLMVANQTTLERAAPLPTAPTGTDLPPSPPFVTDSQPGTIQSGHVWTFDKGTGGWIESVRVWVPTVSGTTSYRLTLTVDDQVSGPQTTIYDNLQLTAGQWVEVVTSRRIIPSNTRVVGVLDSVDSGSTNDFSGGWTNGGTSQSGAPALQSFNRDNQDSILRFDKTDLDGTDRTTELLSLTPTTAVVITQTLDNTRFRSYTVTGEPTDEGSYIQVNVSLTDTGLDLQTGEICTLDFSVPIVASTDFVEIDNYWPAGEPTWASVLGLLSVDGGVQIPGAFQRAYGVSLEFTPGDVSASWDFAAFTSL